MRFLASRLERLGRRIAAAPRTVLAALAVVTAAATPGVIRSDFPVGGAASESLSVSPGANELALHDVLLVELVCEAGLWSPDCLAAVASATRALEERRDLVVHVDSLAARPRVVSRDGRLALRPLLDQVPGDPAALRRLRARAGADPAFLRGVTASSERAALIQAKLAPGARPREIAALVESLRAKSLDGALGVSLAAASHGLRAHELELAARRDLSRATVLAVLGLALLAALATGSARVGLGVGALAGAALLWTGAALAFGGIPLLGAAAIVPCLVCTTAAALGFALVHRVGVEQRAGRELAGAVTRAVGAGGAPLATAVFAGALGFAAVSVIAPPTARPLALAGACSVAATATLVGVGLPALLLAAGRAAPRGTRPGAPWSGLLDGVLARIDGVSRAPGRLKRACVSLALVAVALLGMRGLRSDAGPIRFAPDGTPASDSLETMSRDFGGAALVRVVVDSGAAGGVSEPLFLERVQQLERRALERIAVGSVRSLLDAAVLPAMRASHDDDPGFAVVPPTREQVELTWALFEREAPERLREGMDGERRRLAIDLLVDPRDPRALAALEQDLVSHSVMLFGSGESLRVIGPGLGAAQDGSRVARSLPLAAGAAVALPAALAAIAFESLAAGLLAALPAAGALLLTIAAMGAFGVPLDSLTPALLGAIAFGASLSALWYLARVRELAAVGADLHVAVSVALRDVGRPIAESALASLSFLVLVASAMAPVRGFGALACAASLLATIAVLAVLPLSIRTVRPTFLIAGSARSPQETLSCVRAAERGGEE